MERIGKEALDTDHEMTGFVRTRYFMSSWLRSQLSPRETF